VGRGSRHLKTVLLSAPRDCAPPSEPRGPRGPGSEPAGVVVPLFPPGDDAALVEALRAGDAGASGALFDRYAPLVQRVLARVLGLDPELPDLLHDVFVEALSSIDRLDEPSRLRPWLTSIAVFVARGCIRRRKRRRWLRYLGWDEPVDPPAQAPAGPAAVALSLTYAILGRMPDDERIAFSLRIIDGMELTEAAQACSVSLATIKRRIARAEKRFLTEAAGEPLLAEWLEGGARWSTP
jgi:RNA polymerase sigma-70 factor, ECF subfamily